MSDLLFVDTVITILFTLYVEFAADNCTVPLAAPICTPLASEAVSKLLASTLSFHVKSIVSLVDKFISLNVETIIFSVEVSNLPKITISVVQL